MQEHPCRRNFDNELTMAEIDDQEDVIRELHEARVGTKENYKVLEKKGKVLGEDGKSKVSMGFVVYVLVHIARRPTVFYVSGTVPYIGNTGVVK